MNEQVSVEQALNKGHKRITYPEIAIGFSVTAFGAFLYLAELAPFWIFPSSFVLALILTHLYWSFVIIHWKLWAFENVRNVHELKARAIKERIMHADNSFLNRTEFSNRSQKEKWENLLLKFSKEDVFVDDLNIPDETRIYFSKSALFFDALLTLACVAAGLYMIIKLDSLFIGVFFILLGIYVGIKDLRKMFIVAPQIIISNEGLGTTSAKFYKWEEIEKEDVLFNDTRRNRYYYLTYYCPGGTQKIPIREYKISHKELENLLRIYRGRNNKMNK